MQAGLLVPVGWAAARQTARRTNRPAQVWWVSLLSLTSYVMATKLGSIGMAVCLGSWVVYVAARPQRSLRWIGGTALPYALPILAMASATWSIEPALSFKLGFEFLIFTALAVVASEAQSSRSLMSSLMCALLVGVVASAALRTTAAVGTTGEIALIGVFGSKNNLANFVCLSMISSLPVLLDRRQPRSLRVLAMIGLLLDPVMLIKAHSLGALFAGGLAVATSGVILFLASVPRRLRQLLMSLSAILAAGFGCVLVLALAGGFNLSSLLVAAGKDPSLTGRTFLWSRASEFIAMRPLLGLGYQAFWVQGHVEAEALWRFAQIESRMGFHFHNLYYETAVELGGLGVFTLGLFLVAAGGRALYRGLTQPGPVTAFLCGLVVFFAMRVGVELDFLDPFSTGSFLLPVIWIYTRGDAKPS